MILLGSAHPNPWVSLFDKKLNFRLEYTPEVNQSFVVNQHPTGTEQKTYANGTDETSNRTYGVIDYVPQSGWRGSCTDYSGTQHGGHSGCRRYLIQCQGDETDPQAGRP